MNAYNAGLGKMDHWQPTLEDALNLWARLPELGAFIYRLKYQGDTPIAPDPTLDMGGSFAHMMGIPDPYDEVARLYFILHSDHESGNVSAHAGHLVGSALSDVYYATSGDDQRSGRTPARSGQPGSPALDPVRDGPDGRCRCLRKRR